MMNNDFISGYFMGKEILPHYKNEVVVYYTRFLESKQSKYFNFDLEEFLLNEESESVVHNIVIVDGAIVKSEYKKREG